MKVPVLAMLTARRLEPEIMDQPGLKVADHRHALRGLARLNRLSGSSRIVAREIFSLAPTRRGKPLRVLDLACGGGDVLLAISRLANARQVPLRLVGCDISGIAIAHAREQAEAAGAPLEFHQQDVLGDPLPAGFDVVMCSLFLHHLSVDVAVSLLARMRRAARRRVLVNDLVRSRRGYLLAKLACNVFSRSYIVRTDGPSSVEAAFSLAEVREIAGRAGLVDARFGYRWPRRFLLAWDQR